MYCWYLVTYGWLRITRSIEFKRICSQTMLTNSLSFAYFLRADYWILVAKIMSLKINFLRLNANRVKYN